MKKGWKVLIMTLVVAAFAVTAFGCATTQNVTGSYSYVAWGTDYGCRVRVSVVGNKIQEVVLLEGHGLVQASPMWDGKEVYWENEQGLLDEYVGMTVDQVLACQVLTDEGGVPTKVMNYPIGKNMWITGATQSSGRILLAVQAALKTLGDEA